MTISSVYVGMDQPTFDARGIELLKSYRDLFVTGESSEGVIGPIREWLDEAGIRKATHLSYVWGGLCQAVLEQHPQDTRLSVAVEKLMALMGNTVELQERRDEKKSLLDDTSRIFGYLNAIVNTRKDEFFAIGEDPSTRTLFNRNVYAQKPSYDALKSLLDGLRSTDDLPCGIREALFSHNAWNPVPLLEKLQSWRDEQIQYLRDSTGNPYATHIEDTVQGSLLNVLKDAVADGVWLPQDTSVCSELWKVVHPKKLAEEKACTLMSRLWNSMPNQAGAGLYTVLAQEGMTPKQLDVFFPLNLDASDKRHMLVTLVQICYLCRGGARFLSPMDIEQSQQFESRVMQYHPELFHLLDMHLSFFPYSASTEENTTILVNGFDNMRGTRTTLDGPVSFSLPPGL